jgi:hypothetical protein
MVKKLQSLEMVQQCFQNPSQPIADKEKAGRLKENAILRKLTGSNTRYGPW